MYRTLCGLALILILLSLPARAFEGFPKEAWGQTLYNLEEVKDRLGDMFSEVRDNPDLWRDEAFQEELREVWEKGGEAFRPLSGMFRLGWSYVKYKCRDGFLSEGCQELFEWGLGKIDKKIDTLRDALGLPASPPALPRGPDVRSDAQGRPIFPLYIFLLMLYW